jgi:4-amino-4-deoxy-L-arabinose transferase-like glycosyltransferase
VKSSAKPILRDWYVVASCGAPLWLINAIWLVKDTRPPVWDMALHQIYALNYVPGFMAPQGWSVWDYSGNYPPLVHLFIAAAFTIFRPDPDIATLANLGATFVLFWALMQLGRYFISATAARWACVLMLLTPYLVWMSRETILDYWLSAWIAAAWVFLIWSDGFESPFWSRVFGLVSAFGLLTKWLFAGFMAAPFLLLAIRHRIWKHEHRLAHALQSMMIAAAVAGIWYLPNLPRLFLYFRQNAQVGALEGEPPVFSFQSFIYYLRLLEGYQLYALLFVLLAGGIVFVVSRRVLRDPAMWIAMVAGGWLAMTMLRTKDARFTAPLLAPLLLAPGAWLSSWGGGRIGRVLRIAVIAVLAVQAYATNFGISWLPQQVILMPGYQGSLRWDWQLYSQHYFGILGAPRREDWKQNEIISRVADEAGRRGVRMSLALIPDFARFNYFNFQLAAKLAKIPMRIDHLQFATGGFSAFSNYDFAIMSEGDQGMPWTTREAGSLNDVITGRPDIFKTVSTYRLPGGEVVRLYFIDRESDAAKQ